QPALEEGADHQHREGGGPRLGEHGAHEHGGDALAAVLGVGDGVDQLDPAPCALVDHDPDDLSAPDRLIASGPGVVPHGDRLPGPMRVLLGEAVGSDRHGGAPFRPVSPRYARRTSLSGPSRRVAPPGPPVGRARATMLVVIPDPAQTAPVPSSPAPGAGHLAESAEDSAFSRAADALQRHREPSEVWGDEREAVSLALRWAASHTTVATDPKTTARSAEELQAEVGATITEDGIGAARAMELFDEVLLPATRSSEDPMNLAYIPAAPTRAAVAFDTVVSAANVFGGIWENGAGAIFAENQVLRWLADLLGWPADAAGVFVSGGTQGNL